MSPDLLDRILEPEPPAFALLHRPDSGSAGLTAGRQAREQEPCSSGR